MLVHKGGQINNVQLITGLRIAEMSQLQNCSVIWSCVERMEVIVKMKKKERKSHGGGGMCTKNGYYCEKEKKVRGVRVDVNGEVDVKILESGLYVQLIITSIILYTC